MLKGTALNHFYTSIKTNLRIIQLFETCENMREKFEGEDFKTKMLTKLNNNKLKTVISRNMGKDIEACFQIPIKELRANKMTLKINLQDESFLQNKLLTAYCNFHILKAMITAIKFQ
ncbi:hypothetical protein GcC1_088008 [Golovinomyces cichoracearum]|uniref:Uncharacterized protein n=1 Tax=Golovinomyces cichoracearum TaxID=62708 RepID=A0A420IGS6_9PEZI|nr:hypothetical protein GcC1_088008 [Golovinomyces cichoracearum]